MGLDIDAKYDVGFGINTLFVAAHVDSLNGGRGHGQRQSCRFKQSTVYSTTQLQYISAIFINLSMRLQPVASNMPLSPAISPMMPPAVHLVALPQQILGCSPDQ